MGKEVESNFSFDFHRYCFPFGRPEGSLKSTLSLLERVLMKDNMTPAPQEEVRSVIKKCLESAAYVNYSKISKSARIEGKKYKWWAAQIINSYKSDSEIAQDTEIAPSVKLQKLTHLAEMCVDLIQENNEHYAEVRVFNILGCFLSANRKLTVSESL